MGERIPPSDDDWTLHERRGRYPWQHQSVSSKSKTSPVAWLTLGALVLTAGLFAAFVFATRDVTAATSTAGFFILLIPGGLAMVALGIVGLIQRRRR